LIKQSTQGNITYFCDTSSDLFTTSESENKEHFEPTGLEPPTVLDCPPDDDVLPCGFHTVPFSAATASALCRCESDSSACLSLSKISLSTAKRSSRTVPGPGDNMRPFEDPRETPCEAPRVSESDPTKGSRDRDRTRVGERNNGGEVADPGDEATEIKEGEGKIDCIRCGCFVSLSSPAFIKSRKNMWII
jgi:hypothetical protein